MIRNDLKEKLGEDWRSKFSHRDCDQADYEFGEFEVDGKKINLVLNPKTLDIMDWYYNDSNEWIDLGVYDNRLSGKYFINNKFDIKLKSEKFEREFNLFTKKFSISDRNEYPRLVFWINKNERIHTSIHRLLAIMFIPNPNPKLYNIINHIDYNTANYNLNNLQWCDSHTNNLKENQTLMNSKIVYIQSDSAGNVIKTWLYSERAELFKKYPNVLRSIGKEYKGYFWTKKDLTTENYLSKHKIDPNGWFDDNGLHDFGKFKVRANTCGVLEIDGKITVGCLARLVYNITINSKKLMTHRILYEIITHKLLKQDEIVDHIIPSTKDDVNNEFSNLRVGSQKDNMNNELTRKKLNKQYKVYNSFGELIKTYESQKELADAYNKDNKFFSIIIRTIILYNNNEIITSEKYPLEYKLPFIFYKFTVDNEIPKILECATDLRKFTQSNVKIINRYINTGVKAPDGFYYQQGDPFNLIVDSKNLELYKFREIVYWNRRNR